MTHRIDILEQSEYWPVYSSFGAGELDHLIARLRTRGLLDVLPAERIDKFRLCLFVTTLIIMNPNTDQSTPVLGRRVRSLNR